MENGKALEKLKQQISKIRGAKEKDIVEILKQTNNLLLRHFIIKVKGVIVEPLWIEAYYYDKKEFPDCNTHLSDEQKNNFNKFYFHETGRGGVDVCLSDFDSYYSVLIKAALVYKEKERPTKDNVKTQMFIEDEIIKLTGLSKEELKQEFVIHPQENDTKVFYAPRVGLKKPCFKDELLAAYSLKAIECYDALKSYFPAKCKSQWKNAILTLARVKDENKARDEANIKNGFRIEEQYWKLAKDMLGLQ